MSHELGDVRSSRFMRHFAKRQRTDCRESLAATFEAFGVKGRDETISYYFDAFSKFDLYPDVVDTLDRLSGRFKLAIVSNIDDDLLAATRLNRTFDLQ
jgi:2-haloacid dehalogenase